MSVSGLQLVPDYSPSKNMENDECTLHSNSVYEYLRSLLESNNHNKKDKDEYNDLLRDTDCEIFDNVLLLEDDGQLTVAMWEEVNFIPIIEAYTDEEQKGIFRGDVTNEQEGSAFVYISPCLSPSKCLATSTTKPVMSEMDAGNDVYCASAPVRLRASQLKQWDQRIQELIQFRNEHGHVLVPLHYPANPRLSHWIKRQCCQYKLKAEGKHSTLTEERQALLGSLGFVWDSHCASWDLRFEELLEFQRVHGHLTVPLFYPENPQLAAWLKVQTNKRKHSDMEKLHHPSSPH